MNFFFFITLCCEIGKGEDHVNVEEDKWFIKFWISGRNPNDWRTPSNVF